MRTHLQILLPELEHLTIESEVTFALIYKREHITRQGNATLRQLAQQFATVPFLLMVHTLDTVHTTIRIPPVKKAQQAMAIQSRLQQMLLAPLQQHLFCYEPLPDHAFSVAWTERAPLQTLLHSLHTLGVNRVLMQPVCLSKTQTNAPTCYVWNKALELGTQLQHHTPLEKRLRRPLSWALIALAMLVAALYTHTRQQRDELQQLQALAQQAVSDRWPQPPVVIAPLKQAQQALQSAGQADQSAALRLPALLQQSAQWLQPLAPAVQSIGWDNHTLRITLQPDSNTQSVDSLLEQTHTQLQAQGLQWLYEPKKDPLVLQLQPLTP